mgnify:CR=1 FL=1
MKERVQRHRIAHPRDRISFGEAPISKDDVPREPLLGKLIAPAIQEKITNFSARKKQKIIKKRTCKCGKSDDMDKCKTCGKMTCRRCRNIGSCHIKKYSHGYHGQPYSGSKSRVSIRFWGGNRTN